MRDHCADVGDKLATVKCVEVLGKGFPIPCNTFTQCCTGNVFDALHQLDEELVLVGLGRGEPDPAVAHHQGGHAVRRGRLELGIPCGLTVIVRMDVDEARRHQQAACIDLASATADVSADSGNHIAIDRDA